MAQNTLEVRRDIERIRAELDQTLDALGDHVRPSRIAERRTRKVRQTFTSARERIMGSASSAGGTGSELVDQAREAPQRVAAETRGNPLVAGMVSFGVGLLAASLMPATDMERHAVDAMSDQLEPVRRQATEVAQSVKEQVSDAARESAQHLQEDVKDAAQDVQSTAQSSVGAVKERAQGSAQQIAEAGRENR